MESARETRWNCGLIFWCANISTRTRLYVCILHVETEVGGVRIWGLLFFLPTSCQEEEEKKEGEGKKEGYERGEKEDENNG